MILIPLIVIVAFVVFFIRRENKQALIRQWQLAADSLARIKCDPGGTLSGNPSLYGHIEGRRIDVAAFFHREFGSSSTQMTGYRVERNSPIELPVAAIDSLTKHFPKCEIDAKRIFCGSYGIEKSAGNLTTAINRIAAALRLADTEHAKNKLAQSEKDLVETPANVKNEPPPPLETAPTITAVAEELPGDQIPTYLRKKTADESPAIADALDATVSPIEMQPEPATEPEPAVVVINPVPPIVTEPAAQISEPSLTLAARDLFASAHNHFETTQRFSAQYDQQDVSGHGILRRVETFSNDRFFGRGPGILAAIEIDCPHGEIASPEEAAGFNSAPPPPSKINATIEITVDEDGEPANSIARGLRDRIGEPVEVCGTLIRCDAFDARLYLKRGMVA